MLELRQRTHERTGFAFGAQRRIDFPQCRLTTGIGEDAAHALGEVGGQAPGPFGLGGIENEDDIDIGDVVEFSCSGLTQSDDRQTDVGRLVEFGSCDGQRRVEGSGGQVGEDCHDMVDDFVRRLRRQIIGDEAKHRIPVVPSQRLDPVISGHSRARSQVLGVRTEDREHLCSQGYRRGGRRGDQQERVGNEQQRQGVGMPDQMVDHRLRGADDREEPGQEGPVEFVLGQLALRSGPHCVQQGRGTLPCGLDHAQQTQRRSMRIRGCHEEINEPRISGQRDAEELIELMEEPRGGLRHAGRA